MFAVWLRVGLDGRAYVGTLTSLQLSPRPQYLYQLSPVRFIQLPQRFPYKAGRKTREVHPFLYDRDVVRVVVLRAQPL